MGRSFLDDKGEIISDLPRFSLADGVPIFDLDRTDLSAPELSPRLQRIGLLDAQKVKIQRQSGILSSDATNTLVYDRDGIAENIVGLRRSLSRSNSILDQIDHVQASLDELSQGQTAAASLNRLTQLRNMNRRTSNTISQIIDALDLATTEFLDGDRQQARRFEI